MKEEKREQEQKKKIYLQVLAAMAVMAVKQANKTASRYWSYEPEKPDGLDNFCK